MNRLHKLLTLATAVATLAPVAAFAQVGAVTYTGNHGGDNGGSNFGDPIGQGSLTLSTSTDGSTLNGSITIGGSSGFNDELVIYIDAKAGGINSTSSLTDTGGGNDALREATSGLASNGTTRAPLTFTSGFGADYAIALSPSKAQFGSFYTINNDGTLTYGSNNSNGNANLTPTGTNGTNGNNTFTFSIPISLLGGATSFNFETTYLDGPDAYRSDEAIGNTILDTTNPQNNTDPDGGAKYNLGQSSGMISGFSTYNIVSAVPEPGTWLAGGLLVIAAGWTAARSRRSSVA